MTNMREDIRNVMLSNGSPMRPCEVAHALPQYSLRRVSEAIIGGMYREGIVSRVVREDGFTGYYASRNVKLKKHETEEARREGKRLTDAASHRRRAERRKAERAALRPLKLAALAEKRRELAAARAVEREAAKQARKLERQQKRIAERAKLAAERQAVKDQAAKRALWAKRKAEQRAKKTMSTPQRIFTQTVAPRARQVTEAAPPKQVRMTVEEFLAQGGQIEYVEPGVVAEPLKHIGHRSINRTSWREANLAA